MFLTVKLLLKVRDPALEEALKSYERSMKHEISRIAGAFMKHQEVFAFRYKYISNDVSYHSKSLVVEEAKALYQRLQKGMEKKLDFSSVWHELSYQIDESGFLALQLGVAQGQKILYVPFYVQEQQMKRIRSGKVREMVIKQRVHHWFAYIRLEVENDEIGGLRSLIFDLKDMVPELGYAS